MVEYGETIKSFAKKVGVSPEMLVEYNPDLGKEPSPIIIKEPVPGTIKPGIELRVRIDAPWPGGFYTTRPGDTVVSVAQASKRDPNVLMEANAAALEEAKGGVIPPGTELKIPPLPGAARAQAGEQLWGNVGDPQSLVP